MAAVLLVGGLLRFWQIDHIPPGLWYDEAANAVDARFVLAGDRPLFFEGNNGREPIFIYLIAMAFRAFGPSAMALRVIAAVVGTATLGLAYLLGRRMFDRRVALVATFLLATSYWHINLSRLGLRAGLLPLMEVAAVYCLWRALQERSPRWFAAAGALLGAVGYTYLASRFVPLWLGAFLLAGMVYRGWRLDMPLRRYLWGCLLLVACAAAMFAPLGWYFWQHSETFVQRAEQVVAGGAPAASGASAWLQTLGMFTFVGDENGRHNLPYRPVFDWVQGMAFYAGIAMALMRWRRAAGVACVLWTGVMLLPGSLSTEAPHFLRTAGILPAPMYLAAVAFLGAVEWAEEASRRYHRPLAYVLAVCAVALSLVWGLASAAYDYFGRWAPSAVAYHAFRADAYETALAARDLPPDAEAAISVTGFYRGLPLPSAALAPTPHATRFLESCVVVPPDRQASLYYIIGEREAPAVDPVGPDAVLSGLKLERTIGGIGDKPVASVYRAMPGELTMRQPEHPTNIRLGEAIHISGYDLPNRASPGGSMMLRVYWDLLQPLAEEGDWQFFAHVVGPGDERYADAYSNGCSPNYIRPGDRVVSWFPVTLWDNAPEGTFRLMFGRFEARRRENLPVYDGVGRDIGKSLVLARLRVTESRAKPYALQHAFAASLGPAVELVGYDLSAQQGTAGQPLDVTLYWRGRHAADKDYTVFVQFLDAQGKLVAQHDGQPQGGAYPTTLWGDDEVVPDVHRLEIPAGLAPQDLRLVVGMYDLATGQRLPVQRPGTDATGDHLAVATVAVR